MAAFYILSVVGCTSPQPVGALRETILPVSMTISRGDGGLVPGAVIVAPDTGPALVLEDGARLHGVTVRGRDRSERGAAVVVRGRDVVVRDCVLEGDAASGLLLLGGDLSWTGGELGPGSVVGIMVRGGRIRLESVAISGSRQAGFEVHEGGLAELENVRIVGNGGDGVVIGALARFSMRSGSIARNHGAAVRVLFPGTSVLLDRVAVEANEGGGFVDEGAETPGATAPVPGVLPGNSGSSAPGETRLIPAAVLAEALAAVDFVETELALPVDRFAPPLPLVRACLESPGHAPDRVAALSARLQSADSVHLPGFIAAGALAAVAGEIPDVSSPAAPGLIEALLLIREMTARWPAPGELRSALFDEEPDVTLLESHWLAPGERALTARLAVLARSVDPDSVAQALALLAQNATPTAFQASRASSLAAPRAAPRPRVTGGHAAFWTEAGWFVIGDTGENAYGPGWTAILDRGGDDVYEDAAWAQDRGALVVDVSGDDLYRGRTASAQRGVALLVDRSGNDRYVGEENTQGAAIVGGALLWDQEGDDLYEAVRGAQGIAVGGMGLLVDRGGDDRYEAGSQAQAYAGPGGFAAIVDHSGDDRYALTGGGADLLRNPSARISMGQGLATGFRPGAAGGVAILSDGGGSDRYDASLFAQGCGYWGALGALVDEDGGDVYLGWQYLQGSGVHGAVGMLLDRGNGRDFYQAWTSAQGAGHDLALGVLIDEGGNDLYRSDNLTQGSGNANGTGILVDGGGDDVYVLEQSSLGQGHGVYENLSRRWGSLGVLIDLGGKDRYSGPGRDGTTWTQGEIGVGLDR